MKEITRIYTNQDSLIIHDPTPQIIPFMKTIDPSFQINSITPDEGYIPRFQHAREVKVELKEDDMDAISISELQELHSKGGLPAYSSSTQDSVSLVRIKQEIAFRTMRSCTLCPWQCNTNRYEEKGRCGLEFKAYHHPPFIHIAEEEVINPAIVINFGGCSINCVYCISHELKTVTHLAPLNIAGLWEEINELKNQDWQVNSLEFAGGNPTESLPWIFNILSAAPSDFNLPIVWNSNLYANMESINLLDGMVDVYLPDFNFGNDECAKRLCGADNFWQTATKAAEAMIEQKAKVIFRILVLPNHLDCCQKKVLEFLAQYKNRIWISIMDQYIPENQAGLYHDINRRAREDEIGEVEDLVQRLGLRDIKESSSGFWRSDTMKDSRQTGEWL